jgi:hypothetical protein
VYILRSLLGLALVGLAKQTNLDNIPARVHNDELFVVTETLKRTQCRELGLDRRPDGLD